MVEVAMQPRARLQEFAGEWKGAGKMEAAGATFPLTGRWLCEPVAAGFGIRCEMQIAGIPGMEHMIDVELFGYDDADQQIHAATVCNANETHQLSGGWLGDTLTVEDGRESLAVRIVSPSQIEVHVVNKGGGPVFDLTMER